MGQGYLCDRPHHAVVFASTQHRLFRLRVRVGAFASRQLSAYPRQKHMLFCSFTSIRLQTILHVDCLSYSSKLFHKEALVAYSLTVYF